MSIAEEVHKGRWGYYPCSHDKFLELKEVHKIALRAIRDAARWSRWIAKDPHNRKGPEPVVLSLPKLEGNSAWFRRYFWACFYADVLQAYRNARYPVQSPDEVKWKELTAERWEVIQKLKSFYSDVNDIAA